MKSYCFILGLILFVNCCSVYAVADSGYNFKIEEKVANSSQESTVYQPGEVDVKAVIDKKTIGNPIGPRCGKDSVKILLRVILHSSGKVTDIEVLESNNCNQFQKAAIKAAKKIKFTTAKKNGVFVSQYQKLEYNYSIHNSY